MEKLDILFEKKKNNPEHSLNSLFSFGVPFVYHHGSENQFFFQIPLGIIQGISGNACICCFLRQKLFLALWNKRIFEKFINSSDARLFLRSFDERCEGWFVTTSVQSNHARSEQRLSKHFTVFFAVFFRRFDFMSRYQTTTGANDEN